MSAHIPSAANNTIIDNSSSEDDSEGIEWEDGIQHSPEAATEESFISTVDWEQVTAEVNDTLNARKKRKKCRLRLTKHDKIRNIRLHQTHLIFLIATSKKLHTLQNSNILRGLLHSLAICDVHDDMGVEESDTYQSDIGKNNQKYTIEKLRRWIRQAFTITTKSEDATNIMHAYQDWNENTLTGAIYSRTCSNLQLVLLFAILCQSFGFYCRIVTTLDAYDIRSNNLERLAVFCTRQSQPVTKNVAPHQQYQFIWIEIFHTESNSWVPCNIFEEIMYDPHHFHEIRKQIAPISYIVAFDQSSGFCIDATPRYVDDESKIMRFRIAHEWFNSFLSKYNEHLFHRSKDCTNLKKALDIVNDERKKLQHLNATRDIPTTVEGFKRHSLYILESHLGQHHVIHPRIPAGTFKGQLFFYRENVQKVQSKRKWLQEGRVVQKTESPVKIIKRKMHSSGDAIEVAMFGKWQTEPYISAEVVDGKIPKNKHGNIEIFSEFHVPKGAVHVKLPQIKLIADALEIDYASALTGFETKNGINYPKFEGIVVAEAQYDIIMDAYTQKKQQLIEKAIKVNQNLIIKRWDRLVSRLLLRARLNQDYGKLDSYQRERANKS